MTRNTWRLLVAGVVLLAWAAHDSCRCYGGIVLPNLPLGSPYQLVFVTKYSWAAYTHASSDSGNYLVQTSAGQNPDLPSTTWKVVASYGANASINAPVADGVPIYNLAGGLVATGSAFYSGTHQALICYDQFGDYQVCQTWTGMSPNGNQNYPIIAGAAAMTYGSTRYSDSQWAIEGLSSNSMEPRGWYGLSGQLVAVPEPTVCLTAAVAIGILTRRRHRRHAHDETDGR